MGFHPLHISLTNLDYLPKDTSCVLSVKVFTDDFTQCLKDKYGGNPLLGNDPISLQDEPIINRFIHENLKISINGNRIPVKAWKMDSVKNNFEASWLYYSFKFSEHIGEISVRNTILFNSFNDQKNLMVIGNAGKEKAFQFTLRKPVITLRY